MCRSASRAAVSWAIDSGCFVPRERSVHEDRNDALLRQLLSLVEELGPIGRRRAVFDPMEEHDARRQLPGAADSGRHEVGGARVAIDADVLDKDTCDAVAGLARRSGRSCSAASK